MEGSLTSRIRQRPVPQDQEVDHVHAFVSARTVNVKHYDEAVTTGEMYAAYRRWCATPPAEPEPDWQPARPLGRYVFDWALSQDPPYGLGFGKTRGRNGSQPTKWKLGLRPCATIGP